MGGLRSDLIIYQVVIWMFLLDSKKRGLLSTQQGPLRALRLAPHRRFVPLGMDAPPHAQALSPQATHASSPCTRTFFLFFFGLKTTNVCFEDRDAVAPDNQPPTANPFCSFVLLNLFSYFYFVTRHLCACQSQYVSIPHRPVSPGPLRSPLEV